MFISSLDNRETRWKEHKKTRFNEGSYPRDALPISFGVWLGEYNMFEIDQCLVNKDGGSTYLIL